MFEFRIFVDSPAEKNENKSAARVVFSVRAQRSLTES